MGLLKGCRIISIGPKATISVSRYCQVSVRPYYSSSFKSFLVRVSHRSFSLILSKSGGGGGGGGGWVLHYYFSDTQQQNVRPVPAYRISTMIACLDIQSLECFKEDEATYYQPLKHKAALEEILSN